MYPNEPSRVARQDFQWREWGTKSVTNLQPTIGPAYQILWSKGGTEIVGLASQWLVQHEAHARRGIPPLMLPAWLTTTKDLILQRPRI